jgi:hypothetical protein
MNIYEKLSEIQNELKAPKGQYNSFGKYKYRSCEDILEAVKPICKKYKTTLVLSDEMIVLGGNEYGNKKTIIEDNNETTTFETIRFYIKATATLYDTEEEKSISNTAYAREEESKKGMDGSQITGTASSYARKYALNGLFNIDDTKDADTDEYKKQTDQPEQPKTINATMESSLREMIINLGISNEEVIDALKELKCKKLADLTYDKVEEFRKIISK